MAKIIDGKAISASIRNEITEEVKDFERVNGFVPGLAVIIVGENPASKVYVRNKKLACEQVGFYSEVIEMSEKTTEAVLLRINPAKDVDAFHPFNVGRIMTGNYDLAPCTPAGVMELIRRSGIEIRGKECVIVGRSNIVGKPQAMLMLGADATVTVCHSRTKNLAEVCRRADILVAAIGKPNFFNAEMVKEGAVVIDVGINRREDGKLCGDVNFSEVEPKASYITPVPGGVGPMTITMLLKNTLTAAKVACTAK